MVREIIGCLIVALAAPARACEMPDEGSMPLRRAVTRVELLPEVDAWARAMIKNGVQPRYVVRLDEPQRAAGLCFWPVEVSAAGKLWKRFLVTPDGKFVRPDD